MLEYCEFTKRNQKFTKRKPKSAIILHVEFSIMQPIIGTRLKELREKKNLRQEQVAEIVSVNKSAISLYESGMRQPSLDMLIAFARFYRVSTDYLLGITETRTMDITGLTEHEIDVVSELVSIWVQKNKLLNKK